MFQVYNKKGSINMAAKIQEIEVRPARWKHMKVTIKGTAPLAMQNRSEATIVNLSRKDNGLQPIKFKSSDWRKFLDSMHWIDKMKKPDTLNDNITDEEYEEAFNKVIQESENSSLFYIPTEALKESIIKGASRNELIGSKEGVKFRGSFIILGDKAPITFSDIEMEKTPTTNKNAIGNPMIISVYSKFNNWQTTININYNETLYSADNIINIIQAAGISVGVLARRTEKSFGKYGTFEVIEVQK